MRSTDRATTAQRVPRLRLTADSAPVILWVTDPEGACTWVNRAWQEFTGRPRKEALGHGWIASLLPEDVERIWPSVQEALALRRGLSLEGRMRRHDGELRWMLATGVPRFTPARELQGFAGFCTDVTEHKAAEERQVERLRRADRVKDELLANVSHELRSPLAAILSWAALLQQAGPGAAGDRLEHGLEVIVRSAKHQEQLIEDLLDVSRILTGKLRFEVRTVELAPVVEAVIEAGRPAAEAKGVHLSWNLGPPGLAVCGDPDRLHQVIWNLLSNAVKFTPAGGWVDLELASAGELVTLRISDTGIGIEPEFLPFVFDRFRQAGRQHGGLGLGLAIVRHLVELHGGSVAAASEGEGRGATFTISLPPARS